MKKQKVMFRNLLFAAAVFAILSVISGCKQVARDGGGSVVQEITVTVEKDSHVKEAPKNFKLAKNSLLGFTELKEKMSGLKFNTGYKLGKICLEKKGGKEITDVSKHKFDKDTVIFIVSGKDIPVLKKLTVGAESIEESDLTSEMEFYVTDSASETEVEVIAETDPAGAKITFIPELTGGKLRLTAKETVLKITVGEDTKKSEYTVKVKKTANPKTLIDDISISAGNKQGKIYEVSDEEKEKIFANRNVTIGLAGTEVSIILASVSQTWTSFKVNGNPYSFKPVPEYGLASAGFAYIPLPEKGETLKIKIEVSDTGSSVELNFKIKRLNETVDIPARKLIIGDNNVIRDSDVLKSLADGSKPEFTGFEPTYVEIQCPEDVMKSVSIDGAVCEIKTKKDEYNRDIRYAQYSITGVRPSGKEISIVMEPKDTENYHTLTWIFNLNYVPASPINVDYFINGKGTLELDASFVEGLRNNTNPLLSMDTDILNLKLVCAAQVESVKINNDTIIGDTLTKMGGVYVLLHSIPLNSAEKQIDVTVNPYDKGRYSARTLKFKAKGSGNRENIKPYFSEISGNKNLPKTDFLDRLTDGSKPVYSAFGNSADIVIDIKEYEYEFLCSEIKINNETIPVEIISTILGNAYKIKKSIPVTESPIDVKIEFIGKENIANNLTWEFKVKSGGQKPSIPTALIVPFTINGVGNIGIKSLPKEFTDHLTDGTNPVYEFDGKNAAVEVGSYNNKTIEKVIFKMDGEQKAEIVPSKKKYYYTALHKFSTADTDEHLIEIIIHSKKTQYSNLTYTFKLKSSGKNPPLPLLFNLNGRIRESGHTETLNSETASLLVQAYSDSMHEVKIGEKGVDEQPCIIESKNGYWQAERTVSLPAGGGGKIFVIRVVPKDSINYGETVCEYILTSTKIPGTNRNLFTMQIVK